MSYSSEVLADAPKGYWKLGESSGNFADSSGNSLSLTAGGTITYATKGAMGSEVAPTFGASATGSRPQISAAVNNLTMEAWVYPTSYGSDNPIITNQSAGKGYECALNSSGKVNVTCQGVAVIGGAGKIVPLNVWTHVVVVRDAGTWKSYINGVLDQSSMGTTTPNAPSSSTTAVANTVFRGKLAHCAFYETVLSAARVAAHYNAAFIPDTTLSAYGQAVTQDRPVLYWKLDETTGTVAADSGVNGLSGAHVGSPTLGVAPLITTGFAASYASGAKTWLGASMALSPQWGSAFTVEAWVKTTQTAGFPAEIVCCDDTSSTRFFQLRFYTGGVLQFNAIENVTGTLHTIQTVSAYNDGLTHHVVGTYDGSAMHLYVDGVEVSTSPLTATFTLTQSVASEFDVALRHSGVSETEKLTGTVDEVAFYVYALSLARAQAHFIAGGGTLVSSAIKTILGQAYASSPTVKTVMGVAKASVKKVEGLA